VIGLTISKSPAGERVLGWAICFTAVYSGYFLGWLNHGKLQSTDSPTDSKNWWDMQRVYLDTSVYNRPFDDQSQPRIWLETVACSLLLHTNRPSLCAFLIQKARRNDEHTCTD
jgi:hypothetical protein